MRKKNDKNKSIDYSKKTLKCLHDFKLAYSEFYLSLVLIQNYQSLNFTGFRKILKKHDKLFHRSTGAKWRIDHVEIADFHTSDDIDNLIKEVEDTFITRFEHGNRGKAMKRLRVPPLYEKPKSKTCFKFGFFFGIFLVLAFVIILSALYKQDVPDLYRTLFKIFRCTFLINMFIGMIGLNTYGWRANGISSILLNFWAISVLMFLYHAYLGIPTYLPPLLNVIFSIIFFFQPFKCCFYKWRIFRAPFVRVGFADFWLADQLNSLSFVFVDVVNFICLYSCPMKWPDLELDLSHFQQPDTANITTTTTTTTAIPNITVTHLKLDHREVHCDGLIYGLLPITAILPAWFRFAQCIRRYLDMSKKQPFPHLINAGKYFSSILVEIAFTYAKIFGFGVSQIVTCSVFCFINTTYCYYWDIIMDWGLMDTNNRENVLLRDQLVYRYKAYYYLAIIENFIIRFKWIPILWAKAISTKYSLIVETGAVTFEVIRRFIWNYFRLENEHLNNCGQFRAVRDISVAPIPKSSSEHIKKTSKLMKLRTVNSAADIFDIVAKRTHKHSKSSLGIDTHVTIKEIVNVEPNETDDEQEESRNNNNETIERDREFKIYSGDSSLCDEVEMNVLDEPDAPILVPKVMEIKLDRMEISERRTTQEDEEDSPTTTQIPQKTQKLAKQLKEFMKRPENSVAVEDNHMKLLIPKVIIGKAEEENDNLNKTIARKNPFEVTRSTIVNETPTIHNSASKSNEEAIKISAKNNRVFTIKRRKSNDNS